MKQILSIIVICLCAACSTYKNPPASKTLAYNPEGMPKLTYAQMLQDHDSLVSYLKQVSPIIYFNEEVRGINFNQHAQNLRKQISHKTTTLEYLDIVEKTLNSAQDGHSSRLGVWHLDIMQKYWIPSGFVKGIDSLSIAYCYKYADYFRKMSSTKLDLNLIYTSGEYYNLLPFSYKGQTFPASMQLISCNGKEIHKFVESLTELVSPLRWDRVNNKVYEETFYKPAELYENGLLKLVFRDKESKEHQLNIAKNDTVAFLRNKHWEYGYHSDTDPWFTYYFKEEGIFYAKLPMMVEEYGDSLRKRFESVVAENTVKAVVIDIRGNGGGSDNTYNNFLKTIIRDTLRQNIAVGRNFSPYNQKHFKLNRDSINLRPSHTFDADVAALKNPEMYYITQSYDFVIPEKTTYSFDGQIYILQDKFIYSSASNLSSLAKKSDLMTSIGETPDLLGGLQADPIVMMLPHSRFIFRVEPQIDFTNCKTTSDIFQNYVEYPVPYSIEHLYMRSTTEEDVYSKDFLLNQDPMFKKVLELESKK